MGMTYMAPLFGAIGYLSTGEKCTFVAFDIYLSENYIVVMTEAGELKWTRPQLFRFGLKAEAQATPQTRETKSEIEQIELADCMG